MNDCTGTKETAFSDAVSVSESSIELNPNGTFQIVRNSQTSADDVVTLKTENKQVPKLYSVCDNIVAIEQTVKRCF